MNDFLKREEIIGRPIITCDARIVGKVSDIAVSVDGKVGISVKSESGEESLIAFDEVSALGDVVLLKSPKAEAKQAIPTSEEKIAPGEKVCPKCGRVNKPEAKFCTGCGTKLP